MFLANGGNKSSGGGGGNSSGGGSGGGGFFSSFLGGGTEPEKPKDPVAQLKQWKRDLQKQIRQMERDITDIKRAEQKSMLECKSLAKKGHKNAVKILAKEIVNTRRSVNRMYMAKAQLGSVETNLQNCMCKFGY